MSPHVFLSVPRYPNPNRNRVFREGIQDAAIQWWLQWRSTECPTAPMTHLTENADAAYQKDRRAWAEQEATTAWYILADDDCIPDTWGTIGEAMKTLQGDPEASQFAILSLWPTNSILQPWTPEGYEPRETPNFSEHVSVGGIRFCQRGAMGAVEDWPDMGNRLLTYDAQQGTHIRSLGKRVGYFRNHFMNHWGRNYSTVWRQDG